MFIKPQITKQNEYQAALATWPHFDDKQKV